MGFVNRIAEMLEVSTTKGRSLPMEGVRGLAISLVFLVHYHSLFANYLRSGSLLAELSRFLFGMGQYGVDIFFVLSGYLIYASVIRKPTPYLPYLLGRIRRIYPTFIVVLAIYIALSYLFPQVSRIPPPGWSAPQYIIANAALLPGLFGVDPIVTVSWSLSYEMAFYVLLPLLVWFTGMRSWHWQRRVVFFAGLMILRYFVPWPRARTVMFVVGILLYEALQSQQFVTRLKMSWEYAVLAFFALSFIPLSLLETYKGDSQEYSIPLMSVSFFTFLAYCLGRDGLLHSMFSWGPLRSLGNLSYSFYLIHSVALQGVKLIANRLIPPHGNTPWLWIVLLPIGFLAAFGMATSLFLLVEKPLSFRRRNLSPALSPTAGRPLMSVNVEKLRSES